MNRYIKNTVLVSTLVFLLFSCEKSLDIPLPGDQFFEEDIFSNDRLAAGAVNGIYVQMNRDFLLSQTAADTGLYTDELVLSNYEFFSDDRLAAYSNFVQPNSSANSLLYGKHYEAIYAANAVIEGVNANEAVLENAAQFRGEAYFLRAINFYFLSNLYGAIALPVSTDADVNNSLSRAPRAEVLEQIRADLRVAIENLPARLTNEQGNLTSGKSRPNKTAAKALLAKVFLESGDWQDALNFADEALSEVSNSDLIPLDQVFKKDSDAIIWGLEPTPVASDTDFLGSNDANYFLDWLAFEFGASFGNGALSQSLLDAFEAGDNRRDAWLIRAEDDIDFDGEDEVLFVPYKYQEFLNPNVETAAVLRMADMYLVLAEAAARLNNTGRALTALNRVRQRAGLPDVTATSQADVLDAILAERRIEFFCELGNRFADLKRFGRLDQVQEAMLVEKRATAGTDNISWQSFRALWPIPETEVFANPNLEQTPGY